MKIIIYYKYSEKREIEDIAYIAFNDDSQNTIKIIKHNGDIIIIADSWEWYEIDNQK